MCEDGEPAEKALKDIIVASMSRSDCGRHAAATHLISKVLDAIKCKDRHCERATDGAASFCAANASQEVSSRRTGLIVRRPQ